MNSCLNCKFEPDWGRIQGVGEYRRRAGHCKWEFGGLVIPCGFSTPISIGVTWFLHDNSGVYTSCRAWKSKLDTASK